MRMIHQKALSDIAWDDLEALISHAVPEGPNLEYKRTLADPNGGDDAWIKGQDKIGRHARDELAREIVAFANAYGGLLLLGVEEAQGSNGAAKALAPLPRCGDLAERLHRAIGDMVDPPMPGFDVRAISSPAGDGTGIIALQVAASSAAPHGYGEPPQAYVRRSTSATPMTMRDLQAVFWDARTRRERIDQLRQKARAEMQLLFDRIAKIGIPQTRIADAIPAGSPGMCVRMNAIPHQSLNLGPINARAHWLLNLCPDPSEVCSVQNVELPAAGRYHGWVPRAHGVISQHVGPWTWTLTEDGHLSALGFSSAPDNQHFPGWYVASAAMFIATAERVRRRSGRPDIPIEFDLEFLHDGSARTHTGNGKAWQPPAPSIEVGPFLLAAREGIGEVFSEIERVIWGGFSVPFVMPSEASFARAFEPGAWAEDR